MIQLTLDGKLPEFDGSTYNHDRDHERLGKQAYAVWSVLKEGGWWTLAALENRTGYPQASISARIRDLRKPKFGGHIVEREYISKGLWEYHLDLS